MSLQMRSSTASLCNGTRAGKLEITTTTNAQKLEKKDLRGSLGKVYCHRYVLERIRLIRVTFEITIGKLEK